ncbi:DUF6473 family protein [Pseudoroseicyclus aestuarii]|uniref:DUF6473 domain-containing protein n=1 Tax=Pseudoroseicyclus aestuarii TaxID=1795041 RepID=A0A318STA4_9RHOB|nr:DUF6473 family protein [Pseudoroseicyclus aestuarii]PYE85070.1 hypothetical protein DFP88_102876 [Pseudoroseicyclus aestuarii]
MKHEHLGQEPYYGACVYGQSKLLFRGPRRSLKASYTAFVGSTETFGRMVETPFPALVEQATGHRALNLGCMNAGIDAFLHDPQILTLCRAADQVVLQVMDAANMSNRFYRVHPRRNDRFLRPSSVLEALYPETDFSEICFTWHLLEVLHATCRTRFEAVREELQCAWRARIQTLLDRLETPPHLLSLTAPAPERAEAASGLPKQRPLFVTSAMVEALRPRVRDIVTVEVAPEPVDHLLALAGAPPPRLGGASLPGPTGHEQIARALALALESAPR